MNAEIKQVAEALNGVEYGDEDTIIAPITKELIQQGIVILFGASDDRIKFDGAIWDEIDACGGKTVYVENKDLFTKAKSAYKIKAIWDSGEDYSWTFETKIPHETFDILEDGKKYCRGIIFCLDDLEEGL
ncbi:hypothetical protein FACS1894105_04320 [Clostridia bacterium]|nr:hypothetical protein FACS1894105_04320 [Clostridia bacterium]